MNIEELQQAIIISQQHLKIAKTAFEKLYAQYEIQNYQERLDRLIRENRYSEDEKIKSVKDNTYQP